MGHGASIFDNLRHHSTQRRIGESVPKQGERQKQVYQTGNLAEWNSIPAGRLSVNLEGRVFKAFRAGNLRQWQELPLNHQNRFSDTLRCGSQPNFLGIKLPEFGYNRRHG
ncbi:MAG TPA: hypothetical protein PLR25_08980 [Planctomycetaceae bacterium]|nr:hypothetical protein [Planctomycetaceae bacterium]